jgi:predicted ATP-grasp superfamily ATP-dependent carboligase
MFPLDKTFWHEQSRLYMSACLTVSAYGYSRPVNVTMLKILFSEKQDWETLMRPSLDGKYLSTFMPLAQCQSLDDYDFVVPLTCHDTIYLNKNFPQHHNRKFLTPSTEFVRLADDKYLFNDFLRRNGYAEYLPARATTKPYILKKRIDGWGKNSRIIRDGDNEEYDPAEFFTQEFIPGNVEYATHLLSKNGDVFYHSSRKYTFADNWYVKSQTITPKTTDIIPTEHLPLFERLIKDLKYTGLCCINYKVRNGVVKIFELNPRMGASLTRTIAEALDCYIRCLK